MSNSGIRSAASNGRSTSATTTNDTTMSINSHKSDVKTLSANAASALAEKSRAAAAAATATLAAVAAAQKAAHKSAHNNDSHSNTTHSSSVNANSVPKVLTHRRDSSSVSSGQHQQLHSADLQQKGKTARKFQYIRPQTLLSATKDGLTESPPSEAEQAHLLVYSDEGHLVSGSLDALVKHMVPTSDYYPEHNYVFAFLLSARLFIRPHELLAQISQTWDRQVMQLQAANAASTGQDVVDEAHFCQVTVAASASPLMQRKAAGGGAAAALSVTVSESFVVTATRNELHQRQQRTAIQLSAQNCIRLLAEWIETFPYDFRDERLMQEVRILARKCVYIDNALGRQVSQILQLLVRRLTDLKQYEASLATPELSGNQLSGTTAHTMNAQSNSQNIAGSRNSSDSHKSTHSGNASSSNAPNSSAQSDISDVSGIMDICRSCAHLAHQLTAIELERLSHIGPEEFVQAFAKEYQHSIDGKAANAAASPSNTMNLTQLNDMKKTRNLESYVEWFNRLSYLTASEIVKYPKKKQRVRIIEYWIETARECFNIGNFNSLMAIIAGLNLAPISRLKKTWAKVQSAKFSVLEHQMDPTSNFNSYRSTLKAAMWRSEGATDERERIIIPFFSLFVKDLYFLNEGCSNRLPNNHINFEKCSQLAKQVMEFNEWKKVSCPFERLPHVIDFLQNSTVLNENTLSMASFECEPPENTEEKGRYKTVKAETKQQLLHQLQEQQQQHQHQQP